jgi:MFS family permease
MALYCKEIGLPYSGHFFGFSTVGIIITRIFSGNLQDRFGHRVVIAPAIGLLFTAIILITQFRSLGGVFLASVLWGLGTGTVFPCLQALTFTSVRAEHRTAAASSLFNSLDLGFGAGSVVFGLIAEQANTYVAVYWAASIGVLIYLGFYLLYYLVLHPRTGSVKAETKTALKKTD